METLEPFDNKYNHNDLKRTNTDFKQTNTDNTLDQNLSILQDKYNELEKRIKKAENNTPTIDLSSIENDIDELQTSTATNESNITNLQQNVNSYDNRITTNANDISNLQNTVNDFSNSLNTNSTNISSLTTSVNSCIQAVSEINNGAELPSPLFTIDGISFGTPVYSMYDEYDYEHYFLFKNQSYNRSIWFICEPYTPLHFKLNVEIQVPTSSVSRNLIININGQQVKKVNYANTTAGTYTITTEFNYYTNSRSNELKFYVDSNLTEVHLHTLFQLHGKNVCFLNSKRKFNIAPCVNNMYLFSRTYNGYCQYQMATYENLDFENGWQYIPNYQNYYGAKHHYLRAYQKNANDEYEQVGEYLFYQPRGISEQNGIFVTDLVNKFELRTSHYNQVNNIGIQFYQNKIVLPYCLTTPTNRMIFYYNPNNNTRINLFLDLSSLTIKPNEYIDSAVTLDIKTAFDDNNKLASVCVDEKGQAYLFVDYYGQKIAELGFGTQPFAVYDESDHFIIHTFINKFGTIYKSTYQISSSSLTLLASQIVDYGECIYYGMNNQYFIQANKVLYKKQHI